MRVVEGTYSVNPERMADRFPEDLALRIFAAREAERVNAR